MTTITIEIDDKSLNGKRFLNFLETLGYVSIISKKSKNTTANKKRGAYTALDFLNEWSGAFSQLNDLDLDGIKYEYLSQKHK